MNYYKFTKEERYLNHLVLHSHDVPSAIGLLKGEMGIALVLVHYARINKCCNIEKSADFIIANVLKRVSNTTTTDFATGLSGIGWGIEYLVQNNYMKGCGAEILQDVDKQIMNIDFSRCNNYSLFNGLKGYLHYAIAHIQGANISNKKVFDSSFVYSLLEATRKSLKEFSKDIELKMLYENLHDCIAGNRNVYSMDLTKFIKQNKKLEKNDLTLYSGYAGKIELILKKHNEKARLHNR